MPNPAPGQHQIDDDHGRILALLEKLRYNPENLESVLHELVERFQAHSLDEEALMRKRKIRGLKAHAAEHRAIAAHFGGALFQDLRGADSHEELLRAVDRAQQMLMDHIQCLDLELALQLVRKPRPRKPGAKARRPGAAPH